MRIILILLCVLIIFSSCWGERPKKNAIAHQIMQETINVVKSKYELYFVSIYEAYEFSENHPYKELGLTFKSYRKIERDEGRKILLDIINIFLDNINSNSEIQPYLFIRPFTEKNIRVSIINSTIDKSTTSSNEIFSFGTRGNGIAFDYHIPGTEHGLRSEYETLEEAKRLASENKK